MATVHLLCGLPGSGKTTVARRLEAERRAVRFTLDEWMLALFDLTPYDDAYGARAERVRELIWRTAGGVLALGHDVVLDWSFWSRAAREAARQRAEALGANVLLHYVDVPLAVAEERLGERNARTTSGVHRIDLDDLRRFAAEVFEAPGAEEAVPIVLEAEAGR
jgi:predicted kinase